MTRSLVRQSQAPFGPANPRYRALRELLRDPPLPAIEEREALRAFSQTHEPALAELLVRSNLRFVAWIALSYTRSPSLVLDLIQEGSISLLTAVRRFDASRGTRLCTYAGWGIRCQIVRYLRRSRSVVRISESVLDRRHLVRRLLRRWPSQALLPEDRADLDKLALSMGRSPPDWDALSIQERGEVFNLDKGDISLDRVSTWNSPGLARADGTPPTHPRRHEVEVYQTNLVPDDGPDPEALLAERQYQQAAGAAVHQVLATLSPREQIVLRARYFAPEKTTQVEIGEWMGITHERVRQLEEAALAKMRRRLCRLPLFRKPRQAVQRPGKIRMTLRARDPHHSSLPPGP